MKDNEFDSLQAKVMIEHLKLDKYIYIVQCLKDKEFDVTKGDKSKKFQKYFNSFYDVRRDKKKWQPAFYRIFQDARNCKKKFYCLLDDITNIEGTVDFSYTTKMLATIDPKLPVWDKNVACNIKKYYQDGYDKISLYVDSQNNLLGNGSSTKISNADNLYKELLKIQSEMLKNFKKTEAINSFRDYFDNTLKDVLKKEYPDIRDFVDDFILEDEKILDFFLWKL